MPIIIKEMHVRTVVERKLITETEVSEEVIRKIEKRIVDRLSDYEDGQSVRQFNTRRKNER
jgi:hypothetical protein